MVTYYTNYYDVHRGEVCYWSPWPLVRVTRNRLGREVREFVGSRESAPPQLTIGRVEMRVRAEPPK